MTLVVEPNVQVELSLSEAKVTLAILTQAGVNNAQAKIAQGKAQAKLEEILSAIPQQETA